MARRYIKLATCAVNTTPLCWRHNRNNIFAALHSAGDADIVLLPELVVTGYGAEDWFHSQGVLARAWRVVLEVAKHTQGRLVCIGAPVRYNRGVFNCVVVVHNGEVVGIVPKQKLCGDGVHYENRFFKAGEPGSVATVTIDGRDYPFGDLVFEIDGLRIGFEICEDAWGIDRPANALAKRGVDVILNPSASHFAAGKTATRQTFVVEGARLAHAIYAYANLLGNESGRIIFDGECMIANASGLIARGPRMSFKEHVVTFAVVDVELGRASFGQMTSARPNQEADAGLIHLPASEDWQARAKTLHWEPTVYSMHNYWEEDGAQEEEEFGRAIALGLFDYLRKSHQHGFVVALSGGADSSAVTYLCRLMIDLGVKELGLSAFLEKLAHIKTIAAARNADEIANHLITVIYEPTKNSSDATHHSAEHLAQGLGLTLKVASIQRFVTAFLTVLAQLLGRRLRWSNPGDDLTLQNLQARVRAPIPWALANAEGKLLLVTSNKSEAALGYCTMDGDTAGSLAPIGGKKKSFILRWLRWLEQTGHAGVGPVPGLQLVNGLKPSAELRPLDKQQTDEADLGPYAVQDEIARHAIHGKEEPVEVFQRVLTLFGRDYDASSLRNWVVKFYRLWAQNQWKRERFAPSFHVDDDNFDPRSWCRFPILSGGFADELADLLALDLEQFARSF